MTTEAVSVMQQKSKSREIALLLAFRVANMALAYILIIFAAHLFTDREYILFEKVMFFLMLGNILLSPIVIGMWHENAVGAFAAEGAMILLGLSLFAAVLFKLTTADATPYLTSGAFLYFFAYYFKTIIYTHLITLKRYYCAYGTNTALYALYIAALGLIAAGLTSDGALSVFLLLPSLALIILLTLMWRSITKSESNTVTENRKVRQMFSITLLAHNLFVLLLLSGERYILESYSSIPDHSLSAFLFLMTIASAFHSLGLSLNEWMRPQLFEKLRTNLSTSKLYRNTIMMMLLLFTGFVTLGWPVLRIIAADKTGDFSFLHHFSLLVLSQLLFTLAFMIDLKIVFYKRYSRLLIASALAVITKIIGYYLWDGLHRIDGVIYSNLLAAAVLFFSMTLLSQYKLNHD